MNISFPSSTIMEAKKWLPTLLLTFFLVGLLAVLFIKDPNQEQRISEHQVSISTTFQWLQSIVLNLNAGLGVWQFNKAPISDQPQKPHGFGLSPNLSCCHKSIAADDVLVYCCPPNEAIEPVIDFVFPDPSAPLRVRRPIHKVDEEYLAKYRKAMSIMKSLPYEDPRSFRRQADMHCIYCTGAYNQNNADIILSIHRSWLFFPWHRMLIYFHERILGNLIGDDTFSLSFWPWDTPEGMVIPDLYYTEPFTDTERSLDHSAPHKVADINYAYIENTLSSEEQISTNLAVMYHQMVSGAKKVELFMGCQCKPGINGSCDGPGTIELAPHNALHAWVGKEANRFRENMGVFYSAGRDPIFWVHHPNIDRLWEVWKELRGNVPEIIDPDWLDSYFYFHNEYSQLVRIKIRDVLNITKLRYSYVDVERPWLNARPKPSIDPTIARHVLNMRNSGFLTAQTSDFRPNGKLLDRNVMVKVHKPKGIRRSEKGKEEETVLKVYGIHMKEDMFVKFDVYVNAIDATNIGPEAREFAGTFVSVPRGVTLIPNEGDVKRDPKTNLKLGISELLEDLHADDDDFIWVTLVPRGGTGVNTTIDGILIEYMV